MTVFTDQYLDRLAYQFEDSTQFKALLEAFLNQWEELNDAIIDVRDLRYLNTAEGQQLDNIGEILGLERPPDYDDDDYRFALKIQIMINNTDITVNDTLDILSGIFATNGGAAIRYICVVTLEALYEIEATLTTVQETLLSRIPKTLGVGNVQYKIIEDPETTFAFFEDPVGLGFGTTADPGIGGNFASIFG